MICYYVIIFSFLNKVIAIVTALRVFNVTQNWHGREHRTLGVKFDLNATGPVKRFQWREGASTPLNDKHADGTQFSFFFSPIMKFVVRVKKTIWYIQNVCRMTCTYVRGRTAIIVSSRFV